MHFARALVCAALLTLFCVEQSNAQRRIALVIGNDAYVDLPTLRNAAADARAIAQVLEDMHFRVFKGEDLDYRSTNRLLAQFEAAIKPGDTAFIFYAGHGVALGAENYLLPIDMQTPRAGEDIFVRTEAHAVDALVRRMQTLGASSTFMVIDACRDNPFEVIGVRSIGTPCGLARMDAPIGVFMLFSAGIGQKALDRLSDADLSPNSVFTRILVQQLRQPGISHLTLAKRVQTRVRTLALSVKHQQQPAFYDQIEGEIVLTPKVSAEPILEKIAAASPPPQSTNTTPALSNTVTEPQLAPIPPPQSQQLQDTVQGQQSAALTPGRRPQTESDTPELVRMAQQELARLGCLAMPISGDPTVATRSAIKQYRTQRNQPTASIELTEDLISELRRQSSRVCPLVCPPGKTASGDQCVVIAKPAPTKNQRNEESGARKPAPVARQRSIEQDDKPVRRRATQPTAPRESSTARSRPSAPPIGITIGGGGVGIGAGF